MAQSKRWALAAFPLLAIFAAEALSAAEIFHWVDENGVHHYSQVAPRTETEDVSTLSLSEPAAGSYDPDADIYGVAAQQERMKAMREEMEQKRQAARERQRQEAQRPAIIYREPERWGYPIYRPGFPNVPPLRPTPPIQRPPSTLLPLPPVASPPELR